MLLNNLKDYTLKMSLIEIKNAILRKSYNIGFVEEKYINLSDDERNKKVHWLDLNGYKKGWFADPFFLSMDDNFIYLLVEEFVYEDNKGRLAKITVEKKNYKLVSVDVILELDTHLSFPIFFREGDNIFVYPENYQSGGVNLFSYNVLSNKLDFVKTIIESPLLDTQIVKIEDNYYAFGVKWETNTQEDSKTLMIYKSQSLYGPFKHIQTIKNNKKEERGAGLIYTSEGKHYRPAQSCEGGYGKAVIIYRLDLIDGRFVE